MTKYEFLGDLSRLLSDLPEEEKRQAMKYYEDYFSDAGESQEQEVIRELGSPEKVAEQIKADTSQEIEYGEGSSASVQDFIQPYHSPAHDTQGHQRDQTQEHWQNGETRQTEYTQDNRTNGQAQQASSQAASSSNSNTALIIIIAIVTSPIWLTALTGILGAIVGIFSAALGILAALVLGGAGVAIGGIASVGGGIITCLTGEAAAGILAIGIGCILFSVGSILCYCGVMLCVKLIPVLWEQLVKGFYWCREKIMNVL